VRIWSQAADHHCALSVTDRVMPAGVGQQRGLAAPDAPGTVTTQVQMNRSRRTSRLSVTDQILAQAWVSTERRICSISSKCS
jgi:hypothetical protein